MDKGANEGTTVVKGCEDICGRTLTLGKENMAVSLKNVVPWGRSLDEYQLMFELTDTDLKKSIVGCGDGPASFNAELTQRGGQVVSFDPIYCFQREAIASRFEESVDVVLNQVRSTPDSWVWNYHQGPDHLLENRRKALALFLDDFAVGKAEGRYKVGAFPDLAFSNQEFELALCSHFLFLYSDHFSYDFHLSAIEEMCRIAKDVRIFPILTLKQVRSPYVDLIIEDLRQKGIQAEIKTVGYELQKDGNQALFIHQAERGEGGNI